MENPTPIKLEVKPEDKAIIELKNIHTILSLIVDIEKRLYELEVLHGLREEQ